MHKLLFVVAALGASTAFAQTTTPPEQPAPPEAATQVQPPKTVMKTVCREVEEERGIGSRLNRTTKICKQVQVPAPNGKPQQPSRDGSV